MNGLMRAVCGLALVIASLGSLWALPSGDATPAIESATPAGPVTTAAVPSLPSLFFTENTGQTRNGDVRFYSSAGGLRVGFAESAVLFLPGEWRAPPSEVGNSQALSSPAFLPEADEPARAVMLRVTFEGARTVVPPACGCGSPARTSSEST